MRIVEAFPQGIGARDLGFEFQPQIPRAPAMASRNLCSLSDGFEKFQSCAIVVACTAADKPSNRILAAAATFDKMSATVRFKKFHDLGSRVFISDEAALRRRISTRLY